MNSQKTALIQWTFEIIHTWHIKTFEYAKQHCDNLIVALNTNDLVKSYKHREPIDSRENKKNVIEAIRYVDKVIPAPAESPRDLIIRNDIDVYIVGDEYLEKHKDLIADLRAQGKEVIVSPRWEWCISTSLIKTRLLKEYLDSIPQQHGWNAIPWQLSQDN